MTRGCDFESSSDFSVHGRLGCTAAGRGDKGTGGNPFPLPLLGGRDKIKYEV
jgi:hypothetical protein